MTSILHNTDLIILLGVTFFLTFGYLLGKTDGDIKLRKEIENLRAINAELERWVNTPIDLVPTKYQSNVLNFRTSHPSGRGR